MLARATNPKPGVSHATSTTQKSQTKRHVKPATVKTKAGQEHTRDTVIAAFKSFAEQHEGKAPSSSE